jgi:hypothetical protein
MNQGQFTAAMTNVPRDMKTAAFATPPFPLRRWANYVVEPFSFVETL